MAPWCCPGSIPTRRESWDDIAGRRDAEGRRSSRPPSAIRNSPCRRCYGASASPAPRCAVLASRRRIGGEAVVSEVMRPADNHRPVARSCRPHLRLDDALAHVCGVCRRESRRRKRSRSRLRCARRSNTQQDAALVTPDRALARRVLAALERWNVAVDDSGGDALADTPAGVFARLAAEAALKSSSRSRCSRCSSIRCCGSAPAPARMRTLSR